MRQNFPIYSKKSVWIPNVIIVFVAIFYLVTLQGGHNWDGDFSLYIMHAINIVHGKPYADTNYLYNPDNPNIGPKAFPPIFPLILAPFIAIWGINLKVLKLVEIFSFVALLFYLNHKILPKQLGFIFRVIFLISLGFYPLIFFQVDSITSDLPFLLACYIALDRIGDQLNSPQDKKNHLLKLFLTGVIVYLAFGIRAIGVVILPVVLCLDLIRNKKISLASLVITAVAFGLMITQSLLIPGIGDYIRLIPKTIPAIIVLVFNSCRYYFIQFASLIKFNNLIVQDIVFVFLIELFTIGLLTRIKKRITSFDLFFVTYLAFLMVYPNYGGLRFLMPLLPLYFLYILEGFQAILSALI
jgi:hypothetical protein